jgi:hypothetical protein
MTDNLYKIYAPSGELVATITAELLKTLVWKEGFEEVTPKEEPVKKEKT